MTDPTQQNPGFSPAGFNAQYQDHPRPGGQYMGGYQKAPTGPQLSQRPPFQQGAGQQFAPSGAPTRSNGPSHPQYPSMSGPTQPPPSTGPVQTNMMRPSGGQNYPQVPQQPPVNPMNVPRQQLINGLPGYNSSPVPDGAANTSANMVNGPQGGFCISQPAPVAPQPPRQAYPIQQSPPAMSLASHQGQMNTPSSGSRPQYQRPPLAGPHPVQPPMSQAGSQPPPRHPMMHQPARPPTLPPTSQAQQPGRLPYQQPMAPPAPPGPSTNPPTSPPNAQPGVRLPTSAPQQTGRPGELPVPYHGKAQYSHQVHDDASPATAGVTPGSEPASQRSSRAPSPLPGNTYDALEGQFTGSPPAPASSGDQGPIQANKAAPQTGGITGRRHYPQMPSTFGAVGMAGAPPAPQQPMPQPTHGQAPVSSNYTSGQQTQPLYTQPAHTANSMMPHAQATGLNAGFNNLSIKGDALRPVNLLQERHIIPPQGVEQIKINLPQEFKNVNCSAEIFRSTLNAIPNTQSLLSKSRLPLGILIHPFKDLAQLPVIQSSVIVRCRTCRTYINPFVGFVDMRRWKCNLCYRVNELPEEFNYDPVSKTYGEPQRRPEIRSATIEFIAPSEYMLRPPQPAVYLYVLDVSFNAIETGYLQVFCQVLLDELERIPGDSRTQIGFITFDRSLHFYNLAEGLSQPQQLMVSDVEEVFLPCPDNLLVNLHESKELVIDLMNKLPDMFQGTSETGSALGPALQAAYKLMSPTGGRVSVFQTQLPTVGAGALKCREDPNERAGKKVQHLTPATDFYKKLSLDCSAQQIAVDLFMLNSQYADLATVAGISKYSGGCLHYFPNFHTVSNPSEVDRFEATLKRYFTRKIGFESVMRIRCTRGLSIHTFHGNFFVRSTDLLSLPNINPDAGFGMQMSIDDNLECNNVCFQAALLYTSSKGERRIRVHTLCLPVTNAINEIYASADQQAIVGLLSKMAVDKTMMQSIGDARDAMMNAATDMLGAYGNTLTNSQRVGQLPAPSSLRLMPLYILALMKSTAFRVGASTKLDERVFHLEMCKSMPISSFMPTLYPHLYPVHALDDNNALSKGEQVIPQPGLLQLSSANMDRHGAYLLDTGSHMLLWLAAAVADRFCQEVLGKSNFQAVPEVMLELPELDNPTSERLRSFVGHLQEQRAKQASFLILREDSRSRVEFLRHLIEDRTESSYSYYEFLQHLQKEVKT